MESAQTRLLGIGLVVASAAFFSIAGVFVKMAETDAWTIAGWRGLVGAILLGGYFFWRRRRDHRRASLVLDWRGWFLAVTSLLASLLFIISLKNTYVANVAVIYATAPFMAAALAWVVLGERIRAATMISAAVSLAGVLVIVSGGLGSDTLSGDAIALLMTALFAIYIVATRAFKDTPAIWAVALAALLIFAISCVVADPLAISARDLVICIVFGFTFATAVVCLTEGARLLPVAETALIGTLDVPFAVGFAWLLISESPPAASLIGGAIVMAAIIGQSAWDYVRSARRPIRKATPIN